MGFPYARPICKQILKNSGTDKNTYYCLSYTPDLLPTHATLHIGEEDKVDLWVLDIGPHTITVANDGDVQKTVIRKCNPFFKGFNSFFKEVILELPKALDLPWDDEDKVVEKIGLYLLFS